jgi:hypothetical protein
VNEISGTGVGASVDCDLFHNDSIVCVNRQEDLCILSDKYLFYGINVIFPLRGN